MAKAENFQQSETAFIKDWTKGSIPRNLLLLSWPMVAMESLYVVSQIVDMIWVGKLGSSSIAGVGIANIVLMLIMSIDMGLIVGVRAIIARYVGAGDVMTANHIAGQGFIIAAIWGSLMTIAGILLAKPIISLFGVETEVVAEGITYMRIMFAGWVAMEILVMGLYIIQSSGDTITPLKVEVLIRIIHVSLCPFIVFGWWVFPRWGVGGAALSNIISHFLGAVLVLWVLFKVNTRLRLTLIDFRPVLNIIWRILKIGIPASVMSLQRSFGNLVLTWFIAAFGTLAVAAHSLTSRIEMFLLIPGMALGAGAGVLVGQNLGAGQPKRAERSAWFAVGFVGAVMVGCVTMILLWAENIIGVFTTEPDLIEIGSIFLRIAAAGYLMMALGSVLQHCIAGAGDTVPNMIVSIAMIWIVQLPLAYLLPRVTTLEVYGIRWAMVASTFAGLIAYVSYFVLGKWKTKKI